MIAPEFVAGLASLTGFAETQLRTADRALTVAGLRTKARGKSIPHVTRAEGVRLLLGACASRAFTEADAAFTDIAKFRLSGTQVDSRPDPLPNGFYKRSLGFSRDDAKNMNLPASIEHICGHLAKPENEKLFVWLEIEVSGAVSIQCQSGDVEAQLRYSGAVDHVTGRGVETIRRIHPQVLRWIGQNTEVAD